MDFSRSCLSVRNFKSLLPIPPPSSLPSFCLLRWCVMGGGLVTCSGRCGSGVCLPQAQKATLPAPYLDLQLRTSPIHRQSRFGLAPYFSFCPIPFSPVWSLCFPCLCCFSWRGSFPFSRTPKLSSLLQPSPAQKKSPQTSQIRECEREKKVQRPLTRSAFTFFFSFPFTFFSDSPRITWVKHRAYLQSALQDGRVPLIREKYLPWNRGWGTYPPASLPEPTPKPSPGIALC